MITKTRFWVLRAISEMRFFKDVVLEMQLWILRLLCITFLISVVKTKHPNVHYAQAGFSVPFPIKHVA